MSKFIQKNAVILTFLATVAPSISSAVTLKHTLGTLSGIINMIIPIILALAVLAFFWGLMTYLFNAGSADKRSEGINIMVMGIIAIFIMVSIWGIIRVLQSTFKVDKAKPIIPDVIERRYQ